MDNEWRTIQIFLGKDLDKKGNLQVSEVSLHYDGPSTVRCTCEDFLEIEICLHVSFVMRRMEKNNGSFGLSVPENVPEELAYAAFTDSELSRNFVLRYGKIEVI